MQIKTISEPIWEGPIEAFWMLTNRCNLSCSFCMVESQPHPEVLTDELDRETHLRLAHEMAEQQIMRVVLTGGEPTLIPHLEEIIAILSGSGAYIYLTTNGMLLSEERVATLAQAGLHEGQVSLNGATAEVNDALMGKRSHGLILRGLRWMQEAGLRTQVKVTVTRANQHEMIPLIDRLLEFGVRRISVNEVAPLGRAGYLSDWQELRPDLEVMQALERKGEEYFRQGYRVDVDSATATLLEDGHPSACSLGDDRRQVVVVLPDSTMTPCSSIWKSAIPNRVTEHGWLGAYRRLPGLYGRFLAEEALPEICRNCAWVNSCQGGCRAGAVQYYGTWRAPDPRCPLLVQQGEKSGFSSPLVNKVIPLKVG